MKRKGIKRANSRESPLRFNLAKCETVNVADFSLFAGAHAGNRAESGRGAQPSSFQNPIS